MQMTTIPQHSSTNFTVKRENTSLVVGRIFLATCSRSDHV